MSLTNRRKSDGKAKFPAVPGEAQIGRVVGVNRTNNEHDIRVIERLLGDAGFLDSARASDPTGRADFELTAAIREFQKKNGLKADGFITPSGPTLRALGAPGALTERRRVDGATALPAVGSEVVSANARLVSALRNSTDLGPLPTYVAEAANSGDAGQAEVIDLLRQIRDVAPNASSRLHEALQPLLDSHLHRALYAEAATLQNSQKTRPIGPNYPDGITAQRKPDSRPDRSDQPNEPSAPGDPDEPDEPDDNHDDQARQCEELARQYREAQAFFEAARDSWRKANERYEELLADHELAEERLDAEIAKFALEWALPPSKIAKAIRAGWRIVRGKRNGEFVDIPLPSDLIQGWERVRDLKASLDQQLALRQEFEEEMTEYQEEMTGLIRQMQALGCPGR